MNGSVTPRYHRTPPYRTAPIRPRTAIIWTLIIVACFQRESNTPTLPASIAVADTGERVIATTVGDAHACAVSTSLTAYCWGEPDVVLLGRDDTTRAPLPVGGDHRFVAIAAGAAFTCAADTDGRVFCWGRAKKGELGAGAYFDVAQMPQEVTADVRFTSVAAGREHVCALDDGGNAWCWGDNSRGQLGDSTRRYAARPVRVVGGKRFATLAAGAESYTTCGVTGQEIAYCWGDNANGQLGDGGTESSTEPVAVRGLTGVRAIDPGADATCALTTAQTVFCWGNNHYGQLGLGLALRDTQLLTPTQPVRIAVKFMALSVGARQACAVSWSGTAYCWGSNEAHGLGVDSDDACRGRALSCARSPGPLRGEATLARVSLGPTGRACGAGFSSAAPVYCWGRDLNDSARIVDVATQVALRPPPRALPALAAMPVDTAPVATPILAAPVAAAGAPAGRAATARVEGLDTVRVDFIARKLLSRDTAIRASAFRGIERMRREARSRAASVLADAWNAEPSWRAEVIAAWGLMLRDGVLPPVERGRVMTYVLSAQDTFALALADAAEQGAVLVLGPVVRELAESGQPEPVRHRLTDVARDLEAAAASRPVPERLDDLRFWVNAFCVEARAAKADACTDVRADLVDAADKVRGGSLNGAKAALDQAGEQAMEASRAGAFSMLEGLLVSANCRRLVEQL